MKKKTKKKYNKKRYRSKKKLKRSSKARKIRKKTRRSHRKLKKRKILKRSKTRRRFKLPNLIIKKVEIPQFKKKKKKIEKDHFPKGINFSIRSIF